jgi:hypothetical protein
MGLWDPPLGSSSRHVLRTYRLASRTACTDEVYHARTRRVPPGLAVRAAAQIYEFTHPHLAKYAMALGIVAFGRPGRRHEHGGCAG